MLETKAGAPTSATIVDDLLVDGAHILPPLAPEPAASLLQKIRSTRRFDASLFLSEAEFDRDPQYTGVNPRPGRNLLEDLADDLAFVEKDARLVEALGACLGEDYEILNRKIVCGVPAREVPDWLRRRIHGNPVNNLGAYVRPEYRDITYFYGIDFHQDLIDFPDRPADFVTLYVYLHPVTDKDAPLFLLKGTHRLGGSIFPHQLRKLGPGAWRYEDGRGGEMDAAQTVLTGQAGFAALWHACTLHGTQPDAADHERISLRYLLARGRGPAGLDRVNAAIRGPLSLTATRTDLAADGRAVVRANAVNKA